MINKEHTPEMILKARAKFYDLLTHCIPATMILKVQILDLRSRNDANRPTDPDMEAHTTNR